MIHNKMLDDNKGMSLIFVHTKKGEDALKNVAADLRLTIGDYIKAITNNSAYNHSASQVRDRSGFFQDLDCLSFEKVYRKYAKTPIVINLKRKIFQFAYRAAKYTGVLKIAKKILKR